MLTVQSYPLATGLQQDVTIKETITVRDLRLVSGQLKLCVEFDTNDQDRTWTFRTIHNAQPVPAGRFIGTYYVGSVPSHVYAELA